MVIVEEPEFVTAVGLNAAVAPGGSPLALRLTLPVNPPPAVTVIVEVVAEPGVTAFEFGETAREKSGTVIVSVGGWGSVSPRLSVTVN